MRTPGTGKPLRPGPLACPLAVEAPILKDPDARADDARFLLLLAAGPGSPWPSRRSTRWTPTTAASASRIRHFVSNVPGRFRDFDGVIRYDKQNPAASSVEFTVRAASIDTDNDDRDEHLRSKDFFDVEKYPTLTFTSAEVKAEGRQHPGGDRQPDDARRDPTDHHPGAGPGHGQDPARRKAGFETTFTVDRKEYGITWNNVLDSGPVLRRRGEDHQSRRAACG